MRGGSASRKLGGLITLGALLSFTAPLLGADVQSGQGAGIAAADVAEPSGAYYDWRKTGRPERPYLHAYDQTLVMKIFLAEKSNQGKDSKVYLTFEQALGVIERLDNLTCCAPKIIYLVGWQHNGHDSKYPDWSVVNPRLKRPQDATARESLVWLMGEGFKHHTIVSLHVNMLDAYEDSPLWKEYLAKDIIAKDKDGRPLAGGKYDGQQSYQISYAREWETKLAQKRIDGLLAMLPIVKAGTIHIDAFHSVAPTRRKETTISPLLGYPIEREVEAQRKIIRYFRDRGVDITSEFSTFLRPDAFVGLQPMAWHYKAPAAGIPPRLYCGTPMSGEAEIRRDPENLAGLLDQFCLKAAPWLWWNAGHAADGKQPRPADWERVRQDGDCCVPLVWKEEKTLLAYSRSGCAAKAWQLPPGWEKVERVQLADITLRGPRALDEIPVEHGSIRLSLKAGQGVTISPVAPSALAPLPSAAPRINGPSVFGVRPKGPAGSCPPRSEARP